MRRRRERYVATLLYQYAEVNPKERLRRRLCEESMIVVKAMSAREALRLAKRQALDRRYVNRTHNGGAYAFQFIGVRDLLHLGVERAPNEVWYDMFELLRPMERRADIIPPQRKLNAIRWESQAGRERGREGVSVLRFRRQRRRRLT